MDLQAYWYWLNQVEGVGRQSIKRILDYYITPIAVFEEGNKSLYKQLTTHCKISSKVAKNILKREPIAFYFEQINKLKKQGIYITCLTDENFPDKLRHIHDRPYLLYYRGKLPKNNERIIGIVGARRCSAYGAHMALKLSKELCKAHCHVISGLARGIDGAAHKGALEVIDGGTTIAVLGSGIDVCYPKEHESIYEKITRSGCLISEYAPGTMPHPGNFPLRNRIISGMSDGIVVVEAKKSSGSLITAHYGLDQGKDIFAIPGRVTDDLSQGSNGLIKAGAKIVLGVSDIIEEYGITIKYKKNDSVQLDNEEAKLMKKVSYDPIAIEELAKDLDLTIGDISLSLMRLEIKGLIKRLPNHYIVKT